MMIIGWFCLTSLISALCWPLGYSLQANKAGCACRHNEIISTTMCECVNLSVTSLHELFLLHHEQLCEATNTPLHLRLYNLYSLRNLSESLRPSLYPSCNFSNIVNLTLTATAIVHLDTKSFLAFQSLSELELSRNSQLISYGDGAFQHLGGTLVTLVASDSPVRSLGLNVFKGLTRLNRLVLSRNRIGYLELGIFSQNCCSRLRELRLDRNILTVLDADLLSGLTSLELLDMQYNPIQKIDRDTFLPCTATLTELRMSHDDQAPFGGFASLPVGVFNHLNRLSVLQMTGLKIANLTSETFSGLNRLTYLSLSGNRLIHLPSDLFSNLRRLEHLDLSFNWLICVSSLLNPSENSDFLVGLRLRYIDLSWNHLTHLNHMTSRSLGLFDPPPPDGSRLTLNLTGNPWQHIDTDAFCNPYAAVPIRPTDLVVTPPVGSALGNWRNYLGLWYARALWPAGPLSLIGPSSRVYGLILEDKKAFPGYQSVPITEEDIQTFGHYTSVVRGALNAVEQCQELRSNNGFLSSDQMNSTRFQEDLKTIRIPSMNAVAFSMASYCPRLSIRQLEDWEAATLNLTETVNYFIQYNRSPFQMIGSSSRLYLLVIFGVCITFLLVTLTVIICYRAWSRKALAKYKDHSYNSYHPVTSTEPRADKQLFLPNRPLPDSHLNGPAPSEKPDKKVANGTPLSPNGKSTAAQSLPNTSNRSAVPHKTRGERADRSHMRRRSREPDTSHLLAVAAASCQRTSGDRPKSESDLEALTDAGTLTSLGMV